MNTTMKIPRNMEMNGWQGFMAVPPNTNDQAPIAINLDEITAVMLLENGHCFVAVGAHGYELACAANAVLQQKERRILALQAQAKQLLAGEPAK